MDKLEEIFKLQEELNDHVFVKQGIMQGVFNFESEGLKTSRIRDAANIGLLGPNDLPNTWLRNYLKALQEEGKELEAELLWKWWSKDKIDMQNIRVEIVDIMHFLVSLALAAGLNAEEFRRLYVSKHRVNEQRQEQGYSKETKDETDNKSVV